MRLLVLALVVCTAVGCGGAGTGGGAGGGGTAGSGGGASAGGGTGGSGGVGGGTGGSGGSGGSGGGTTSSAPSCSVAEDCPYWYCDCKSGPPVNSRRCINNRCIDGASSCGSACANFGTCWLGISSGGFPGGSNAGPSTCPSGTGGGAGGGGGTGGSGGSGGGSTSCPFSDLGKGCSGASACQSQLCFGANPSFECTKACTTANDCPLNWTCDPATGGGKVCTQGSLSGTKSTSSVCSAIAYTDVGGPCTTACKSGFCTSTNICTRRCNVASDCPSTWTCTAGASFKLCIP